MHDHWHAIVLSEESSSISDTLMRVKISAHLQISKARDSREGIWQSRFYDHVLRTRREFDETLDISIRIRFESDWSRVRPIGRGRARAGTQTEPGRFPSMKFGYRSIPVIESEENPQVLAKCA
jgi:hypothetical protein